MGNARRRPAGDDFGGRPPARRRPRSQDAGAERAVTTIGVARRWRRSLAAPRSHATLRAAEGVIARRGRQATGAI